MSIKTRTGARSALNLLAKLCKLSHTPGFTVGLDTILGEARAAEVMALWTPLCALVDSFVAADNWFNKMDHADDDGTGEDVAPEG